MAKKKQEEQVKSGGWITTFSDLMNLLLCFFVLLFSMSTVDAQKFQEVIASLQNSFSILPQGGSSVGDGQMVGSGISQLKELDIYFNQVINNNSDGKEEEKSDVKEEFDKEAEKESEKMAEEIGKLLEEAGLADKVNVEFNQHFVLLTLNGAILFDSGKAEIMKDAKPIIEKIAIILKKYEKNIIEVEGHTDNVPLSGRSKFENNDVLSFYRALMVANYIKEIANVDPKRLKYAGRGETIPVASNNTAEGRAKNRRVEIKIYNSFYSN